ncbi:hypothetical protein [Vitiosangium sp. GDMCC 1.1324]|uniref:hypothetical protein n=1 Tax=Vitiosangium sp. (strain GDMCC 1.1324) TaxID=2138576 RepID=UPI0018EE718D|nr:hypothetical protein [Vitiosangium sp. GDMCC 1.1324]
MESTLRPLRTYACALALVTTFASCTKTVAPGTTPSNPAAQKTPFPGGAPITPSDLTATPAALPLEPPPYDPSISREEYARFAWRQFIHLNSPAKPTGDTVLAPGAIPVVRGVVDPNRNFAASGDPSFFQNGTKVHALGSNQLVWETFAHRSELFPADHPPRGALSELPPRYAFANVVVDP